MMSTPIFPTRALSFAICAGVLLVAACDSGELSAPQEAAMLSPTAVSAAKSQTDICHRTTTGDYTKISVADAAYDTHVDHGDGGVYETVPGNEAYIFGEDCQPIPAEPYCPCYPTYDDLGDLRYESTLAYPPLSGGWKTTLTAWYTPANASASFDGSNGACAITHSDGTGQSYSPIREVDALVCSGFLDQAGLL